MSVSEWPRWKKRVAGGALAVGALGAYGSSVEEEPAIVEPDPAVVTVEVNNVLAATVEPASGSGESEAVPTAVPPTLTPVPPTAVPATSTPVPATAVPPTLTPVPPTAVPATSTPIPPTAVPATATPVPPTPIPVVPTATPVPLPTATPTPVPPAAPTYFKNCSAARDAGAAPVYRGDPGYGSHLDRDGDGVGCEN